ncbi:MAG: glycosyltransferase family 39 protein [Ferruginibacter sp.]|nr:glycosyltransferase family 39 protein [Ferruginibacter sp.]
MSKKTLLLLLFILVKIVFQYFLINPVYDLHRDEYLHLDQAKHLAWGYESVPPFTSWISWIILQLGNAVFWIKFFPALFGALTIVVVWMTIEELKGNLFSLVLGASAVTFSVILRINLLYQPNSFDILCWTFLYFSFIKYIHSYSSKWLWIAAITFAIGSLNKYNIVFLLLGLLPAILLTEHRIVFRRKNFYFSISVAILLIAPNLVWQYQHDFPVVHHLKTLSDTQLVNVNRIDFLKEQLLFFLGSIFIIIAAFISFFRYPPFKKYRVFGWSFVFTLLLFIYLKAKGYYAIGLYPIYLAFGAVYLEQISKHGWKRYLRPATIIFVIAFFIPFFKIAFPISSPASTVQNGQLLKDFGLLRWEDGKDHLLPQDYADMLGWSELAIKTDSAFNMITNKENTLVLCDNYGQAGAINFYSKHSNIGAVSMNADYINWFPLHTKEIKNILLVKEADDPEKDRGREKQLFKTVKIVGKIENKYAREKGTTIYLLENAVTSINKILQQEIAERKSRQ